MLSIVVPTFNESENLEHLLKGINTALEPVGITYEVVIVDDSSVDGTAELARNLGNKFPISILERCGLDRDLSLSVLAGIREAKYDNVIVMDADLSHPPGCLPSMLQNLKEKPESMVIGSRYVTGGSFDREWKFWRYLNSRVATLLARPLTRCSDPMSGFFGLNKKMLQDTDFKPQGYKIALELIVRCDFSSVDEIPIRFKDREAGESKMNLKQQLKYLLHLRRLYMLRFGAFAEFLHFGFVGLGGLLVDITFYYLLQFFSFSHLQARALSFWPAVTTNWFLNRTMTFGDRKRRRMLRQWFEFVLTSFTGFSMSWGIYYWLTTGFEFFDQYRFLALFPGMVLASVFNFIVSSLFVYSESRH